MSIESAEEKAQRISNILGVQSINESALAYTESRLFEEFFPREGSTTTFATIFNNYTEGVKSLPLYIIEPLISTNVDYLATDTQKADIHYKRKFGLSSYDLINYCDLTGKIRVSKKILGDFNGKTTDISIDDFTSFCAGLSQTLLELTKLKNGYNTVQLREMLIGEFVLTHDLSTPITEEIDNIEDNLIKAMILQNYNIRFSNPFLPTSKQYLSRHRESILQFIDFSRRFAINSSHIHGKSIDELFNYREPRLRVVFKDLKETILTLPIYYDGFDFDEHNEFWKNAGDFYVSSSFTYLPHPRS